MSIFKFKRFDVDQSGCAMKVNTDGVLLGALANAQEPQHILDIGTGTGVIALMLAQRFGNTFLDAVEIDNAAAVTAVNNFNNSVFKNRLRLYEGDFEIAANSSVKYDLIVSNPPFFLDSLESVGKKKSLARHTDRLFFERLIRFIAANLTDTGTCQLILPLSTSNLVKSFLPAYDLNIQQIIRIKSFTNSEPHREILIFGNKQDKIVDNEFIIYDMPKVYSKQYATLLKDFFTIF